jgi:gliding motility-associated-like protein
MILCPLMRMLGRAIFFFGCASLPIASFAQTEAGVISRSQCVVSGGTPANLVSVSDRNAIDMGSGFYWESAGDVSFTVGLVSNLSANSQTFVMGAHAGDTYYRRVVPTGLPAPNNFYYSNTIKISIVGAPNSPTFIPISVSSICQGDASFTVSFSLLFSPTKYSIVWDAAPSALNFVDVLEQSLPGSSPLTVNVPTSAPFGSYSGTLIPYDANGCSIPGTNAAFTFNPKPTVNITNPSAVCAPGIIDLTSTNITTGSTGGLTYTQWTDATATTNLTTPNAVATSGTYYIKGTTAATCFTIQPVIATINPLPTATITPGGATTFCAGRSVNLSAPLSSNYMWNTGATTQSINITSTGSNTVTITDVNGCSATSSATAVTVNVLPTATITPAGATTFCAGGSINLSAPLSSNYMWNTGATTQSINITSTGSNTVTITDVNGCSATSSATAVTANALPTATITPAGATTFCAGGSVNLSAPLSSNYMWSTGATTQSINITSTGSNTVTITDVNGCSATSSATAVTVNALPTATIIPGSATTFCAGGSVNLSAPLSSNYLWNTGATTQSINITSAGSNTVTITDVNGCSATSSATVVTVNAPPVATITPAGATTFCAGGSVNLSAPLSNNYMWSTGATTQSINITSTGSNTVTITDVNGCSATSSATAVTVNSLPIATITPGGATTFCTGGSVNLSAPLSSNYLWSTGATTQSINITSTGSNTVTITDVNGCSAISSATAVTVNPLPAVTINAGGPTTFCSGGSVTLNSTAGVSYLWSSGQTGQSINVNNTGSRTVTMTDVNGCSATSTVTSITVNPLPTVAITPGGTLTFCSGGSVTLTSTAGSSYVWSSGQTTQSINVNSTGTRTVTMTDVNGCSATSSATSITVNPLPIVAITPGGTLTFCSGGSVALTSTAGSSYVWSSGQTTQSINVNNTGTRTVTMTDVNGCSATSTVTSITVNPLPIVAVTPGGTLTFCNGGSVALTATSGSSYLWSSGETTQSVIVSTTGTRRVTMTDVNGCSAISSAISVTVNPLPVVNVITGNNTVCVGSTITLANTTPGGIWTSSIPSVAVISSSGVLTAVTAGTTNVSYSVTDVNNCTASVSSSTTINPVPLMVTVNPAAVCAPNTVDITQSFITAGSDAAAGLSYWTNAAASGLFITPNAVANSGTYYIKGTFPATGCSSIQPVIVTVNPLPSFSIINPAAVCVPATVDITTAAITNGTAAGLTLSYWSNQTATTALATPASLTVSGTYYIKGIAVTGCSVLLPVSVTVNSLPGGSLQMPTVNFICDGAPLTLTASNSFAYQWYNNQQPIGGATAATYNPTVAGNYSVQFSSAAGCKKNSDSTITLSLFVKPLVRFNASGLCVTAPVSFTNTSLFANSGSINWLWDFGDGSSSTNISVSHNYRQAGSYNVSLTANNVSCPAFTDQATTAYSIEAPAAAARYDTVFAVSGRPFVLSAREIGSVYQWRPSTGLSSAVVRTPTATVATDVSYTVTITSSAGCVTTDTVFVKMKNDGEIYVAQGFTPNADGLNDRAYPILVGVKQLVYFKIFNRWGNLLFQTNDETPQNGWDGKYQGRMQQAGTYTWVAEVIDGNGKTIQKKGSLLLIN